jgi:HD-like signal output (HDOD) protein
MDQHSHPDISILQRVRSLRQFDEAQLKQLALTLEIRSAESGACLIELGSCEKSSLFLIDGNLRGISHNKKETRFSSTSGGELLPVAAVRPCAYRIVADGPVRYLKLSSEKLSEFARRQADSDADLETLVIDETTQQADFKIQLFKDLLSGKVKLPSMPNVAQRIQQAYADDLVTAETVGVIIQSDPVITAKMMMVANSPLYGGRVKISNLQQAVVRIGLENTRRLVMGYAVSDLFDTQSALMRKHMRAVWKHSVHVASLSRLLAESLAGFNVEKAQLAGLVHHIGEVAILQYAQQNDELRDNPTRLIDAVQSMRPQITGMLLEEWNFSDEMIRVGQECDDWFRNPNDQSDLCDLVLIAQYHALIGTSRQKGLPPIRLLPAFAKLGMDKLEVREIIGFLNRSRDKIKWIESHLGA